MTAPADLDAWRQSRWRRVQLAVIAGLGYAVMRALGATLRWRVVGLEHYAEAEGRGHAPILAFWHGRILPATVYFRHKGIVVMTSRNFDGEWIARIIERFGFATARGSSSRGGSQALREMARALRRRAPVGFTLDGPRGPVRVAQPGAVWLASRTGHPLLPFHLEAQRAWRLGSWDAAQIPKPFSLVAIAMGEPMVVARDADDAGIADATATLERQLATLETQARNLLAEPGSDRRGR